VVPRHEKGEFYYLGVLEAMKKWRTVTWTKVKVEFKFKSDWDSIFDLFQETL
jgi:hypothetical protein